MQIKSKLPNVGTTIFTVMSQLANEHQAINLAQGFPNFDCPLELRNRVAHHLQNGKNQYAPMAGALPLRKNLARKIEKLYNRSIDPNTEITITAGATQGLFTAIAAFVGMGDEVILIEPAYDCYRPAIEVVGGVPVIYELKKPDYQIDWEAFGALITEKTKMIIINTPHNPVSKTLKSEDMEALAKLTKGTNIIVISDEVYEHLVFDGQAHESALRHDDLYERCLAVYSFGKTFHSTGWKVGYVVGPELLMSEFRKVHRFNVFCVSSFVQYGLADYLENEEAYLQLPSFYQAKRDYFANAIAGTSLKPYHSEGSFFQMFDYSAVSDLPDTEFVQWLTIEHGVAAIPVSAFYSSGRDERMIRFCFAKTEEVLAQAGGVLRGI